jgi:hypothetical protein
MTKAILLQGRVTKKKTVIDPQEEAQQSKFLFPVNV